MVTFGQLFMLMLVGTTVQTTAEDSQKQQKFIFYDVNPGEGFNLRRDVFMRIAVFVRNLNQVSINNTYNLVLPPWGRMYHWQSRELGVQEKIPWAKFFEVSSIRKFVPVMELEEFIEREANDVIDQVFYLQGYSEGWSSGNFEEKYDFRDCIEPERYFKKNSYWRGYFWGFHSQVKAKDFKCVSVQGITSVLNPLIEGFAGKSVMLDRAENLLHQEFGGVDYWLARRSMRFARNLVAVANDFRKRNLDSTDEKDDTVKPIEWAEQRPQRSGKRGGPFACVHLRRKDFAESRTDQIPSLKGAADQLKRKLEARGLNKLFVATDAPDSEFRELKTALEEMSGNTPSVYRFRPSPESKADLLDGGVAVVDQIVCSHASYFVGSHESTFTFRIQEEREIMGFEPESTFDMMCRDGKLDCTKGSQWKIKYPPASAAKPIGNNANSKSEL